MADREKVLRYFKAGGDEQVASKLLDLAEGARKSRKYKVSDFLDPHGQNVAEIVAANFPNVKIQTDGGLKNPERAKVAFVSEEFYGNPDFGIEAYAVKWDKRYYDINHRDILGAFMGIGCKREVLGDIIFIPEGAQFVADSTMEPFILANLQKIGAAPVEITTIPLTDLQERTEQVKIIKATVAALRLDAVAAAGYGVSRSHMADEIKARNVKINWQEAKSASQAVNKGDIISFRSRGRVEVDEIKGLTKKGRTSITLKRFI